MFATDHAQDAELSELLFAEELEERLEMCWCDYWGCDGKGLEGPLDCRYCIGICP